MSRAINLHYLLPSLVTQKVIELNRMLVLSCGSEVDFGPAKQHIPHVTIFMGTPKPDILPETLIRSLLNRVPDLPSLRCRVSPPYLKEDRPNWAFLDILPIEPLILLKRKVLTATEALIEPPAWDYTEEIPHITVGYITHFHGLARKRFRDWSFNGEADLDRVQISYMGKRGTCIEPVAEADVSGEGVKGVGGVKRGSDLEIDN